jgi:epoxyqueuosine reductase
MDSSALTSLIKQKALEIGFSDCGISSVETLDFESVKLNNWLQNGFQGEMHYMENHFEKRINPNLLFENAKSVISVLFNYYKQDLNDNNEKYRIAKYAQGNDYHYIIKSKLNELINFIQTIYPNATARSFCDTAPVMDKVWAQKSGLGWLGKNTCLIAPKAGSFFFIGEIITDIELNYDKAINNRCGNCTKCIDACPTIALVAPYQLDSRKCISYLTIEYKNEFDEKIDLNGHIFGCDICQDVCPWNIKYAKVHNNKELISSSKDVDWDNINKTDFIKTFKGTALERTGYERLKRNIDANYNSTKQ